MIAAFGPVDEMVVKERPLNKDNSLNSPFKFLVNFTHICED